MTCFEIIIAIVNIIAVIAAPIIAVKVGQYLQDRAQSRKDKMDIFKTLMVNRYGWSIETVQAMNIIEIVFSDDDNVLNAWKDFYDKSCIENISEIQLKKMQTAKDKTLRDNSTVLGLHAESDVGDDTKPLHTKGYD